MENFIYKYFIQPIWEKNGYNIVNTTVYALIAITATYLIYKYLKGRVKIDDNFLKGALAFVLFGSTLRVVTDSIDGGIFQPITPIHQFILENHLLDYGYITVSPGIYVLTAALFLSSLVILHRFKRMKLLPYVGFVLWVAVFLLLLPFMTYVIYAFPVLLLAAIPAYLAWMYFKDLYPVGIVAGQALDGAATFFIIDYFSHATGMMYFEQHVVGGMIGNIFGTFFVFYLVKIAIAFLAAYFLKNEESLDEEDIRFMSIVIMIMGFAPGIRDMLRMVVGS